MAAKKGNLNKVKELVNKSPADVSIKDPGSGVSMRDYTIIMLICVGIM